MGDVFNLEQIIYIDGGEEIIDDEINSINKNCDYI